LEKGERSSVPHFFEPVVSPNNGEYMEQVVEFLSDYQWWIYGVLGLILLFYLRRAILARRDGARSIFKLEQEQARARYSRSVAISAVILLVMVAVFVVGNPVISTPAITPQPTPTETSGPLAASTLTPTPPPATITPTATPTAVRPAACPNPGVRITSPGVNQVLTGNFPVRGTASTANFQYYKLEVGPGSSPRDHEWTVVGQLHERTVSGGVLETFNSGAYPVGTYTLRLVVVDQTGNYPEPCRVTIRVER
jgi:hypothetical protein